MVLMEPTNSDLGLVEETYDFSSSEEPTTPESEGLNSVDDDFCSSSSPFKFQFRSELSHANWRNDLAMAEVIKKKGKMWVSTGIVRSGKTLLLLEEALFMVEVGALILDQDDAKMTLNELYNKLSNQRNGCSWEAYEAYKHLKLLGYIVIRYGLPWSVKRVRESTEVEVVEKMLTEISTDDVVRPFFEVYLPNSKFRKSCPGSPSFVVCFYSPLWREKELDELEKRCGGVPMKFCHVDRGRVSFFSFDKVHLPCLP